MPQFFHFLDKKVPEGINQFVRLWVLVFIIMFGLHTHTKLSQIDEKVSSTKFDARLQQIESILNQQMQILRRLSVSISNWSNWKGS